MADLVDEDAAAPPVPFIVRFADVTPITQDDGPNPVVAINYNDDYRELMDIFRAVTAADERSERALDLTAEVIEHNAANYTAWHFRRRCLEALGADLYKELRFIEEKAYDTPKNYQIWFHRRAIVESLGDASSDLQFVSNVLLEDGKNYHAWSHRQWVLKTYGLWDGELDVVDELLTQDVRNNSAWNQRWFVIDNTSGRTPEVVAREIAYAFAKIKVAIDNESPWNYLRGLMRVKGEAAAGGGGHAWQFGEYPQVKEKLLAMRATEAGAECIPLLGLLFEIFAAEGTTEDALGVAGLLIMLDTVRAPYWTQRQAQLS
eukprot:CAMPEP_0119485856 /NCGR_PEP_ID=MMETSP1344-20130328/12426_1 /TAXON_ID=236787 /ORGANISM="Florenciella parvula, Strain CCMP2471" /LENGTH=316 /DNA_ID=CAMNT_0007520557 /DNA_START=19 /DNA_END=969 /DNA_ORIENTATION=+